MIALFLIIITVGVMLPFIIIPPFTTWWLAIFLSPLPVLLIRGLKRDKIIVNQMESFIHILPGSISPKNYRMYFNDIEKVFIKTHQIKDRKTYTIKIKEKNSFRPIGICRFVGEEKDYTQLKKLLDRINIELKKSIKKKHPDQVSENEDLIKIKREKEEKGRMEPNVLFDDKVNS